MDKKVAAPSPSTFKKPKKKVEGDSDPRIQLIAPQPLGINAARRIRAARQLKGV